MTYTMIRSGVKDRQVSSGDVTFDVDSDGMVLGVYCPDSTDWVPEIIKLLMAGRLRIDVEE